MLLETTEMAPLVRPKGSRLGHTTTPHPVCVLCVWKHHEVSITHVGKGPQKKKTRWGQSSWCHIPISCRPYLFCFRRHSTLLYLPKAPGPTPHRTSTCQVDSTNSSSCQARTRAMGWWGSGHQCYVGSVYRWAVHGYRYQTSITVGKNLSVDITIVIAVKMLDG